MKVIYLHGLGSNGQSSTARGLSESGFDVISPDYRPQFFNKSMDMLSELVLSAEPCVIAGTSMGAYYALKLFECFALPTVAVNPCFDPSTLLKKYLDEPAHDYVTDTPIFFDQDMLNEFTPVGSTGGQHPKELKVLVGIHDDVIPPALQQQFCREQGWSWSEVDWGHRVDDVDLLSDVIRIVQRI